MVLLRWLSSTWVHNLASDELLMEMKRLKQHGILIEIQSRAGVWHFTPPTSSFELLFRYNSLATSKVTLLLDRSQRAGICMIVEIRGGLLQSHKFTSCFDLTNLPRTMSNGSGRSDLPCWCSLTWWSTTKDVNRWTWNLWVMSRDPEEFWYDSAKEDSCTW